MAGWDAHKDNNDGTIFISKFFLYFKMYLKVTKFWKPFITILRELEYKVFDHLTLLEKLVNKA